MVQTGKVNTFPSERVLPLINSDDKEKVYELIVNIEALIHCCEVSHSPVPYFCCFGRSRRTDCLLCFRPIFGSTKQMGLILSRTFEGVRVKIPTEDDPKLKLDCMFFSATCEPLQKKEDVVS